ncbi:DUF4231 domain-containing protein [Oceanihabitans sp. 2_MG-2023]|uniref:DUF4231 domain-containing protein n=1 Tax=Oceanihabitans sp. 2_MG-2023 TaxID=3062661 RepID=UPI0026E194AF|nr:DUF4231 domain-containing protein [Oceanihabitans sp. 2_MG-2023]MDO6595598.1 DUF4231 domain-containing protein [Oceanihabitans sp. 2_MG-2023]
MNRWHFNSKENFKSYNELIERSALSETDKILFTVSWLNYLKYLDKIAIKDSLFFNVLQILILVVGILIPIIEQTELNSKIGNSSITVISVLGITIAIATALIRHFRFEERWKHYRKNAEIIRNEGEDFLALTGNYESSKNIHHAFKKFIENITVIKRQEVDSYIIKVRKKE